MCELATIESGQSATVTIRGTPTARGELVNEASVRADEHDTNLSNNEASTTTNVRGALVMSKVADSPTTEAGGSNGYTITVTNPNEEPVGPRLDHGHAAGGLHVHARVDDRRRHRRPCDRRADADLGRAGLRAGHREHLLPLRRHRGRHGRRVLQRGGRRPGSFPVTPTGPTAEVTVTAGCGADPDDREGRLGGSGRARRAVRLHDRRAQRRHRSGDGRRRHRRDSLALAIVSANASTGSCEVVGSDVTCTIGALAVDGSVTVTIRVDTPFEALDLFNSAVVSSDQTDAVADGEETLVRSSRNGVQPFTTIRQTDFVEAGHGGVRGGDGTGTLVVSGVTGTVERAYVFWHGPTNTTDPTANGTIGSPALRLPARTSASRPTATAGASRTARPTAPTSPHALAATALTR